MNTNFKRFILISLTIIFLCAIAGAFWFWDMTRIIESPYPQIIRLSENMTDSGFVAYSITRLSDKIIVTPYCTAGLLNLFLHIH